MERAPPPPRPLTVATYASDTAREAASACGRAAASLTTAWRSFSLLHWSDAAATARAAPPNLVRVWRWRRRCGGGCASRRQQRQSAAVLPLSALSGARGAGAS